MVGGKSTPNQAHWLWSVGIWTKNKLKIIPQTLGYVNLSLYVYYVLKKIPPMNYELNPTLLDSEFDSWICENLMYQPAGGGITWNYVEGYGCYTETTRQPNIKDSGKSGSERIYRTLKAIEKLKGIKL